MTAIEIAGFSLVVLFLWLDELLDFPHLIFHGPATPINITESVFESVIVIVLGTIVVLLTRRMLKQIRHLKGFHRICADCRRIETAEGWIQLEAWVRDGSEADFSHGLCPECSERWMSQLDSIK